MICAGSLDTLAQNAIDNIPPVIATYQAPAEPVAESERYEVLHIIRGFALLGILLLSMSLFTWPVHLLFLGITDLDCMDQQEKWLGS